MSKIWYSVQVWSGLEEDIKQKVEKLLEEKGKGKSRKDFCSASKRNRDSFFSRKTGYPKILFRIFFDLWRT